MKTTNLTPTFQAWLDGLKDEVTRAIIAQQISNLQKGLGDVKFVGDGLKELRIHVGPGWRVYFIEVQGTVVVLLVGGDKSTQTSDIAAAKKMLAGIKQVAAAKAAATKPAAKPAAKPRKK